FLPRQKLIEAVAALIEVETEWVSDNLENMIENQTLVFIDKIDNTNGVYLRWVYDCERNITNRVILSSKFMQSYQGNYDSDIKKVETNLNIVFAENQKKAIMEACCHQMMILTGGPGTGKTTTLNGIIKIYENKGITFTIAAPTGRAAKRVTELTGKDAKTIHRLLEYGNQNGENTFMRNRENPLKYDAVIIDESSMIDIWLFNHLLDAIPANTKIIMVGDANQLQPVGPGSVFKDIIASGIIATVELKEIFRQAKKSLIITNAHRIINGEVPEMKDTKNDFFFIPAATPEDVIKKVTELYCTRLPNAYNLNPLTDIQVLSPTRKTTTGTVSLNIALKNAVNPPDDHKKELKFHENTFREGDKIMQVRNNYDITVEKANGELETGVFNGDIGIIDEILEKEEGLIVRYDDKKVVYTTEMLEDIELAYAITVHKSQGSEFNAVILPLLDGANMLYTRNLLYTAVTRAKKILIILGSPQKVLSMVKNNITDKRYSGLKFQIWTMNK
ncbi:MAG: helicase, RecD/TraA family, partial [Clostridia bacterium]|nr:helicase, RecD/TraA family [Clostridia bacterium]